MLIIKKINYIKFMVKYFLKLNLPIYSVVKYVIFGLLPDDTFCSKLEKFVYSHKTLKNYIPDYYVRIHVANYCAVLKSHNLYCNKLLLMDNNIHNDTKKLINNLIFEIFRS